MSYQYNGGRRKNMANVSTPGMSTKAVAEFAGYPGRLDVVTFACRAGLIKADHNAPKGAWSIDREDLERLIHERGGMANVWEEWRASTNEMRMASRNGDKVEASELLPPFESAPDATNTTYLLATIVDKLVETNTLLGHLLAVWVTDPEPTSTVTTLQALEA